MVRQPVLMGISVIVFIEMIVVVMMMMTVIRIVVTIVIVIATHILAIFCPACPEKLQA